MNLVEDYCSKEVRNLLVTKGFLGDMWYDNDDIYISHALAMKWLREKGWHIAILYDYRYADQNLAYIPLIIPMKAGDSMGLKEGGFDTYEQAVEAALKYALKNLI